MTRCKHCRTHIAGMGPHATRCRRCQAQYLQLWVDSCRDLLRQAEERLARFREAAGQR